MKINPVSFGKTVKVKAPFHEAVRIANAANGAPTVKPEIQKKVQRIFDDTKTGHALAYTFNDQNDFCYILSGKESREYLHNLYQKALKVKKIKMTCPLNEALPKVIQANNDFKAATADLINRTQEKYTLKIGENGSKVEIIK